MTTPACRSFAAKVESRGSFAPYKAKDPAESVSVVNRIQNAQITGCAHLISGTNIGFDKDRHAVQRPANS